MTEEAKPAEAPAPKKKTPRKHSPQKWQQIESAWKDGKFATMADLCAHFKIEKSEVTERFTRKGVRRGQNIEEYNRKLQKELEKKAEQEAKVLAERIQETREWHYATATGIARLVWKEMLTAREAGAPVSSIANNLKSYESAMKVLKMAREERFAVLGLDREGEGINEDDTPELLVNELTQDQIEEMRQRGQPEEEESEDIVNVGDEDLDMDETGDLEA